MLTATLGERNDEDEGKDSRPASKSNLAFLFAGSSTSYFNTLKGFLHCIDDQFG